MLEQVQAKGKVSIVLTDENGNIKDERNIDNMVVTIGKNHFTMKTLGYLGSTGSSGGATISNTMSHMAVGTLNTAAATGQTTLATEIARVAFPVGTPTLATTTTTGDSIQYVATFAATVGTGALVEAGIFNASSAGNMLCRTVFSTINKGASDSMTITWTVSLT